MKKQPIPEISQQIAIPLEALASPQRIAILLAIGHGEACVCHLESALGWRQAYISQHLMALRKADILADRRQGRYVYYRLRNTSYVDLLKAAANVCGLSGETLFMLIDTETYSACECPHCSSVLIPTASL
jgi:ArsR family transcriptional regulator